jgi:uncharacterized membrane protein YeiB
MARISEREKRTVRIGAALLGIYLVLFYGIAGWKLLQKKQAEYDQLHKAAVALRDQIKPYEDRAQVVKKLMDTYHMDPARLSSNTVVAGASAAIQKAAQSSGLQVGPIRESGPHAQGKELATMQIECSGPVTAMMGLLKRMETLGYPLVIESVQISPENSRPGQIKVNLAVVILDFEQWRRQGGEPHV